MTKSSSALYGERIASAVLNCVSDDSVSSSSRTTSLHDGERFDGALRVLRAAAEHGLVDVPTLFVRLRAYVDDALLSLSAGDGCHHHNRCCRAAATVTSRGSLSIPLALE